MNIQIDVNRIVRELETLAGFSSTPAPAVTRVVFSEEDIRARAWFYQRCVEAGLQMREDAVGNTFARWVGSDTDSPAVGTGSHIDAIPNAGRYDGTVGVLGGLEAIRALQRIGYQPKRSIELLLFTAEEPTRFGIGCLGSRLLSGTLAPKATVAWKDADGRSLDQVRLAAGFSGDLAAVKLPQGYYSAFVELHIEQGPLLEQRGVDLGVVTAIAAPASFRIDIYGQGGHAGAVLMTDRHDAFLASAEIALALEAAARCTGAVDSVATTGVCQIFPSAINSIPSQVHMEADIRDIDESRRDKMIAALNDACERVANGRQVRVTVETINRDAPCASAPAVSEALERACQKHSFTFDRMVSRAYHDSLFMSRISPTAMLFIPCRDGVSHRPDEYASPEAIGRGALVLAETLRELSA
jgi:N-carbamoyl-L-amino-acid hydrolase